MGFWKNLTKCFEPSFIYFQIDGENFYHGRVVDEGLSDHDVKLFIMQSFYEKRGIKIHYSDIKFISKEMWLKNKQEKDFTTLFSNL